MNERFAVQDFFDDRAPVYSKVSSWSLDESLNSKSDQFLNKLHGNIAIELGSGTGILISRLNNFRRKIALDISKEMLNAITDNSIEKVIGDVHKLEFPKNYFDLIICRQLLHYCHLSTAFTNIEKVLKRGGFLHIVQMVNLRRIPKSWDQKWAGFRNVYNRKYLRASELEECFNKFALKSVNCETVLRRSSHSWSEFFLKNNISKEREAEIRLFFESTPKYISNIIKLELDKDKISYNRVFKFWLLKKK